MLKDALRALSLSCVAVLLNGCNPGPLETVLIGTWEITFPYGMDASTFMTFYADHMIVSFGDSIMGQNKIYYRGRWSADEKQVCIEEEGKHSRNECWTIVKKRWSELRFHLPGFGYDHIWTRRYVAPPQASTQAKNRTAGRPDSSLSFKFGSQSATASECLGETLQVCEDHYSAPLPPPGKSDCPDDEYHFRQGELEISVRVLDNLVSSISFSGDRPLSSEAVAALLRTNGAYSQWAIDVDAPPDYFSEFRDKEINFKRGDGAAHARYEDIGGYHGLHLWSPAYSKAYPDVIR